MKERSREDFASWNEVMAKRYNPDQYHNSKNVFVRGIEALRTRAIMRALHLYSGDTVLDIGCGAGNMLEHIGKRYGSTAALWGVDLSVFLLGVAKEKLASMNAHLVRGDVEQLSSVLSGHLFNKIICSEVIEHVEHPDRLLEEVWRVATPDSVVIFSIPNDGLIDAIKRLLIRLGVFDIFFAGISKDPHMEWHIHDMNMHTFETLVRNRFSVERIIRIPLFILPLRYVFVLRPHARQRVEDI